MTDDARVTIAVRLPLARGEHDVDLAMPSVRQIFPLLLPRPLRTPPRMQVLGPAEIQRTIARFDGRPCDVDTARKIHGDPVAFSRYAGVRGGWLESFVETGTVRAACPHCRSWQAELAPLALAVGLRVPFPPVVEDDLYLALPTMATETSRGSRPSDVALAATLAFDLPAASHVSTSTVVAGAFFVGDTTVREAHAWNEWAPEGSPRIEGREQWRRDVPGFRAALRLTSALEWLDESGRAPAPDRILDLMLADFLFLDTLHRLAHDVSVPPEHGLTICCVACGKAFLPLL